MEQSKVEVRAPLEPRYWVQPSGNPVTRPLLMVLLNDLQRVYVRGSYGASPASQARLENLFLEDTEVRF